MSTLLIDVRQEVVDFHDFFTDWFNGTTGRDRLDAELVERFSTDMTFISPEGVTLVFMLTVTAPPRLSADAVLAFELTVSDGSLAATDSVQITVETAVAARQQALETTLATGVMDALDHHLRPATAAEIDYRSGATGAQ